MDLSEHLMRQPGRVYDKMKYGVPMQPRLAWASLIALPCVLVISHLLLLLHDVKAPQEMLHCWQTEHGGPGLPGPPLLGNIMHWLAKESLSEKYHCQFVLHPYGNYAQTVFLLLTWLVVIWSSFQTRHLLEPGGCVGKFVDRIFASGEEGQGATYMDSIDPEAEQVKELQRHLRDWHWLATWRHVGYMCSFQLVMFCFDWYVKGHPLRFIVHDQVVWLSFSATAFLQVGLLNMYCVQLSLTLVEFFLESILSPKEENKNNFQFFTKNHIQLQKDLLEIWGSINLHAVCPALPYLIMSFTQLQYPDMEKGLTMATFLLSMFGVVLYMTLCPIADISSCFTSSFVLRGEPRKFPRRTGQMAIAAAVRHTMQTEGNREPHEDQRFQMFLHYVESCNFSISLRIPGLFLMPVTSRALGGILWALVLKFPAFISIYIGIQKRIDPRQSHIS